MRPGFPVARGALMVGGQAFGERCGLRRGLEEGVGFSGRNGAAVGRFFPLRWRGGVSGGGEALSGYGSSFGIRGDMGGGPGGNGSASAGPPRAPGIAVDGAFRGVLPLGAQRGGDESGD